MTIIALRQDEKRRFQIPAKIMELLGENLSLCQQHKMGLIFNNPMTEKGIIDLEAAFQIALSEIRLTYSLKGAPMPADGNTPQQKLQISEEGEMGG